MCPQIQPAVTLIQKISQMIVQDSERFTCTAVNIVVVRLNANKNIQIQVVIKSPLRWNEDFPLSMWFHNSAVRSQGVSVRLCVFVCHTWAACWCPAWRASQSSARTSCVTCVTTHRMWKGHRAVPGGEPGEPVCSETVTLTRLIYAPFNARLIQSCTMSINTTQINNAS